MADPTHPRALLRYPAQPSIRAATSPAVGRRVAVLSTTAPGGRCEISLPASNVSTARRMVAEAATNWNEATETNLYKGLLGLSKATAAGELYPQLVDAHRTTFVRELERVAADYGKTGKYTPEHARQIVEARKTLARNLNGVIPARTGFNIQRTSASDELTARLSKQAEAAAGLEGRPARNLARNIIKRGSAMTAADDVSVQTNLKLAKKLSRANMFVQVTEFVPPAAVLLTTKDDREREKALAQLWGKGAGFLADKAATVGGPALCVFFGLSTFGWGGRSLRYCVGGSRHLSRE